MKNLRAKVRKKTQITQISWIFFFPPRKIICAICVISVYEYSGFEVTLIPKCQFSILYVNLDGQFSSDRVAQQCLRQVIEQETLDGSLHGACSEVGVVTLVGQEVDGLVAHFETDAILLQHALYALYLQTNDLLDLTPVEGLEDDCLVDTVQEFRTYAALDEH